VTWVCLASGPSLTAEDIEVVRLSGLPTIAVNSTWKSARFCHYLYAGDRTWWDREIADIDIPAERWSCAHAAVIKHGLNYHRERGGHYNSGQRAVQFAASQGADRIIMLGYDCQPGKDGKLHHHEDHPGHRNPKWNSFTTWEAHFVKLAKQMVDRRIEVINCSRETALTCFVRRDLAESLGVGRARSVA